MGARSAGARSCCRRPPAPTACTCCASACPRPTQLELGRGQTLGHDRPRRHHHACRRPAGQGAHRLRRRGRRHPGGPLRPGAGRAPARPRASRSSSTGSCADGRRDRRRGARRAGRGLRRPRSSPPAAPGSGRATSRPRAPGSCSTARRPAWPRPCGWSTRSGGCPGASPAPGAPPWCSTLPGSTSGAVECLDAVLDVVPHALRPHWPATDRLDPHLSRPDGGGVPTGGRSRVDLARPRGDRRSSRTDVADRPTVPDDEARDGPGPGRRPTASPTPGRAPTRGSARCVVPAGEPDHPRLHAAPPRPRRAPRRGRRPGARPATRPAAPPLYVTLEPCSHHGRTPPVRRRADRRRRRPGRRRPRRPRPAGGRAGHRAPAGRRRRGRRSGVRRPRRAEPARALPRTTAAPAGPTSC